MSFLYNKQTIGQKFPQFFSEDRRVCEKSHKSVILALNNKTIIFFLFALNIELKNGAREVIFCIFWTRVRLVTKSKKFFFGGQNLSNFFSGVKKTTLE